MAYTYISVWRDGEPFCAFEIPDPTWIGDDRNPPMEVRPLADGSRSESQNRRWRHALLRLRCYQDSPNHELSESYVAWERGWDVPAVNP